MTFPKTQVQHVIEYAEATPPVHQKKGVKTPLNLITLEVQEDTIKEKSRMKKLALLQLQGPVLHLSEFMYMKEFLYSCLLD